MAELTDRVALVTGAASGIGRGIAERFAEAGAALALVDINGEGVSSVAAALPRAVAIAADIADDDQARGCVERTVAEFGRLDVLVNNAAIQWYGTVETLPPAGWDRLMSVNLRGAFLFSRYAVPHMRAHGGGVILHIASVHAFMSWPNCPAYDAAKAGLLGLTRAMAIDHGPDGIRVNAICPGYTRTPLLEQWLDSVPDRESTIRQLIGLHPVGRMGTPRDVAEAALFLASDAASFITGTSLVVDGGVAIVGH